jgi:hypothetical protein
VHAPTGTKLPVSPALQVEELLRAAELQFDRVESEPEREFTVYSITFSDHPNVMLIDSARAEYLQLVAPVGPAPLKDATAADLRRLLVLSSSVSLAKLEIIGEDEVDFLAATSECSKEQPSADKLRRRIEACARLAMKISDFLQTIR